MRKGTQTENTEMKLPENLTYITY